MEVILHDRPRGVCGLLGPHKKCMACKNHINFFLNLFVIFLP